MLGLELSTAPAHPKSPFWSPQNQAGEAAVDPLGRGLVRVKEEVVILLGAPLGSEEFVARTMEKKVRDIPSMLQ